MDVIFAFSSTTDSVWHGPANRVHTRINFFSFGVTGLPVPPSPSSLLILHSVSMFIAFAILYPLGIYVARYYRNLGRWLAIHQNLLSSVTSNVAVAALTAIIGTFGNVNSAHYKVGMAVIGLIALNFMCGSTAMKLYNMHHKWSSLASVLKTIHKYSGIVAYLVGIAACYLGVAELSTQESGTYLELSFLIIVLIVPVTLFVYGEREKHFATASKDDMGLNNLPFFRWEDVNQRVSLGAKWIVIDNIIYDVHKYLNFHPGGPHALYQMIGIDAKFAFDPKKAQSKDKDGQKMKKAIEFHKYDPELEKLMHCHSRFAKNLLSGFAMGQLRGEESLEASNSSSSTNLLASSDSDSLLESGRIRRPRTIPVHVEIYKHYIIEKKIQLTSPNAPNAVYLIRLMFEDEHAEISNKPGDSYLFQFVDATGKLVTRSYTPISCVSNGGIDFMIKMYNGEMTHYLMNAQSVRMRGPVPRAHLLNPFSDTGTWKVLGLIAGGTGITAMLLVIDYHMRNSIHKKTVFLLKKSLP
ncbi:hypothetical protein BC830DRAFT_207995 [Chytriomyces sp. MP71]|nr:hypothetical protein BC830DRAFT_207995 [Chytriomyces sp. MP71]